MTVKNGVNYTLVDSTSGKTVWTKNVLQHVQRARPRHLRAPPGSVSRTKSAARDNIQQAITDISTLNL